jgi:ERCC4-related helicase
VCSARHPTGNSVTLTATPANTNREMCSPAGPAGVAKALRKVVEMFAEVSDGKTVHTFSVYPHRSITERARPGGLEAEIAVLDRLLVKSAAVKASPTYAKWDALRDTLDDKDEMRDDTGARRKIIIFTEHKDTLDDLVTRLTEHLGRDDAVVTIHGGTKREDRNVSTVGLSPPPYGPENVSTSE